MALLILILYDFILKITFKNLSALSLIIFNFGQKLM